MRPQPRMQNKKAYERNHHGRAEITRHSPRNGFTTYNVISPVIGLVVTVIGGTPPANLTPASRRQNHTISSSASRAVRQRHISVHRIPPRVRDDRDRPSMDRDGGAYEVICVRRERKYFREQGLDSELADLTVGQSWHCFFDRRSPQRVRKALTAPDAHRSPPDQRDARLNR